MNKKDLNQASGVYFLALVFAVILLVGPSIVGSYFQAQADLKEAKAEVGR